MIFIIAAVTLIGYLDIVERECMKSNSQVWHLNPAGFGVEDLLSNEQKKWKRMENQVEKSGECSHGGLLENRGQKKKEELW